MPIRDILLFLTSYPVRTPAWAIEAASSLANNLEARLSAALCQIHLPPVRNWLADKLVQANALIAAENAKSKETAQLLLQEFVQRVGAATRGDQILIDCVSFITPTELARRARTYDLTIVPIEPEVEYHAVAEGLIFDSARPALLLPRSGGAGHQIDTVVVGWDGSRAATRAVADAMPFLKAAKSVQLLLITGEKEIDADHGSTDMMRHLRLHGVEAELVEVPAGGEDAGSALMKHCLERQAGLLVVGAFGHSRTREFVLGGATRSVLDNPQLPVLLAH